MSDQIDDVFVSAVVYLPETQRLTGDIRAFAERVVRRVDGSFAVTLGECSIETNDSDERQSRLLDALAVFWQDFVRSGLDAQSDMEDREVVVSFSLSPTWGQAGISIPAQVIRPWIEAGAFLHINSYCN